jgi:hypothetical protein
MVLSKLVLFSLALFILIFEVVVVLENIPMVLDILGKCSASVEYFCYIFLKYIFITIPKTSSDSFWITVIDFKVVATVYLLYIC